MNRKRINIRWILLLLPVALIAFDRITKVLAADKLKEQADFILIKGVLQFHYLENRGAAWGIFQGRYSLLSIVSAVLMAAFIYMLFKIPKGKRFLPLYLINLFMIAGAAGNLYDRLVYGFVTDFVYFSLIDFPVFNVADIYITCSVFVLVILILFKYSDEELSFLPFFGSKPAEKQNAQHDESEK